MIISFILNDGEVRFSIGTNPVVFTIDKEIIEVDGNWILRTGEWDDTGTWDDNEFWQDE